MACCSGKIALRSDVAKVVVAPGRPATRLQAAGLHTAVAQPPPPGILPS